MTRILSALIIVAVVLLVLVLLLSGGCATRQPPTRPLSDADRQFLIDYHTAAAKTTHDPATRLAHLREISALGSRDSPVP